MRPYNRDTETEDVRGKKLIITTGSRKNVSVMANQSLNTAVIDDCRQESEASDE